MKRIFAIASFVFLISCKGQDEKQTDQNSGCGHRNKLEGKEYVQQIDQWGEQKNCDGGTGQAGDGLQAYVRRLTGQRNDQHADGHQQQWPEQQVATGWQYQRNDPTQ